MIGYQPMLLVDGILNLNVDGRGLPHPGTHSHHVFDRYDIFYKVLGGGVLKMSQL